MIIEIGTNVSNLPNEEGAHLVSELLFVLMRWQNGSTCKVQEILAYFEEMFEIITIIGNEITVVVMVKNISNFFCAISEMQYIFWQYHRLVIFYLSAARMQI